MLNKNFQSNILYEKRRYFMQEVFCTMSSNVNLKLNQGYQLTIIK
jgi:hypothetical protein